MPSTHDLGYVGQLEAERDQLRDALWACYQTTGADTSDDDKERPGWEGYAVQEVGRVVRNEEAFAEAHDAFIEFVQQARPLLGMSVQGSLGRRADDLLNRYGRLGFEDA